MNIQSFLWAESRRAAGVDTRQCPAPPTYRNTEKFWTVEAHNVKAGKRYQLRLLDDHYDLKVAHADHIQKFHFDAEEDILTEDGHPVAPPIYAQFIHELEFIRAEVTRNRAKIKEAGAGR